MAQQIWHVVLYLQSNGTKRKYRPIAFNWKVILSTDSKRRTILYSLINNTTRNWLLFALLCFKTSSTGLKRCTYPVQRNKQHHRKVLLSSFRLNGHTTISSRDSKVRTTSHYCLILVVKLLILGRAFVRTSQSIQTSVVTMV